MSFEAFYLGYGSLKGVFSGCAGGERWMVLFAGSYFMVQPFAMRYYVHIELKSGTNPPELNYGHLPSLKRSVTVTIVLD